MAPVIVGLIDSATIAVTAIDGNTAALLAQSTAETSTVVQNSPVVVEATNAVATAQQAVQILDSAVATAQSLLQQASTARTAVDSATANANTQFIQANQAIAQAQAAVNTLQATISTVRSVLANTDDDGILMTLPFSMLMGNTLYSNIYLGSNAVITFGTNQGWVYYTTPSAPSVSVGGFDWTTWSQGSGITYATTPTSLSIAWDVRAYPTMDHSVQMTQLRFDADVNPNTGAWVANVSGVGPYVDNARWNYRQTTNGTITQIVDSNSASNDFQGSLGQGSYTPVVIQVDSNTARVQAQIDSATATIQSLNIVVSGVVVQNSANASAVYSIPSTSSANSAIRLGTAASDSLTAQIENKSETLTAIIITLPTSLQTSPSTPPTEPTVPQPSLPYVYVQPAPQPQPEESSDNQTSPTESPEETSSTPSEDGTQSQESDQFPEDNAPVEDSTAQDQTSNDSPTEDTGSQDSSNDSTPNDPSQLPTDKPLLPPAELLVAKVQVDKAGVLNGGQQFFGTKTQPQVIGEDGKLTPPPPPPGSGLPIHPDAVTLTETFIGQPGGVTFNSPDVAVPVDTITVNIDIPGIGDAAQALANTYVALANVGNDMSPITRKKAKKILIATVVAGQIVQLRRRF